MSENKEALAGEGVTVVQDDAPTPSGPVPPPGFEVDDLGETIRKEDPQGGGYAEGKWDPKNGLWRGTDANGQSTWWDINGKEHPGHPEGTKEFFDHKAQWEQREKAQSQKK